ncbi:MAG: pre-16S rRNA-processing nuclease YqgF [Firmicutes bacterium]|nr:pre-16S rRNA-processing nuclease YqgF [Bacillota bacterium]
MVLGIDPGREKCGIAVVQGDEILIRQVVPRGEYLRVVRQWVSEYNVEQIVLGDGTGSKEFFQEIQNSLPNCGVTMVDERLSTEEARQRYWRDNLPRGWRRILPTSMQVPPEPYDDYVAVILAERFLASTP